MQEHILKIGSVFPFFENKSFEFQEGFCLLFGSEIKEKSEIFELVESYRKLMWHAVRNGKKITKKDIYLLRGESVLLVRESGIHHWPSRREKNSYELTVPIDFHNGWHKVNENRWKRKELRDYWKIIILDEKSVNAVL